MSVASIPIFRAQPISLSQKRSESSIPEISNFKKVALTVYKYLKLIAYYVLIIPALLGWIARHSILPASFIATRENPVSKQAIKYDCITSDGAVIKVSYIQGKASTTKDVPTIILFSPNGALKEDTLFMFLDNFKGIRIGLEDLATFLPCNILAFDYRGTGESKGCPYSEEKLVLDGDAVYQFVRDQLHTKPENIHMYGLSLGGGVEAQVKALHPECTGRVVFDRTFSSLTKTISSIMCRLLAWLAKLYGWSLDNTKVFDQIQGEKLILRHREDEIMKFSSLADAVPDNTPNVRKITFGEEEPFTFKHCAPLYKYNQKGECFHGYHTENHDKLSDLLIDFLLAKPKTTSRDLIDVD